MSFTLRPYQLQNYTDTAHAVSKHKRIINCIATGGGKTKIAISIVVGALSKGKTVLIVTESDKIYKQLDNEIPNTVNINAAASLLYLKPNTLYLAMAQTLVRRERLLRQFAMMGAELLIINDEAHIGTSTKLLLQLSDALLIGLTATPVMKWAKHLPLLYNSIVVGPQPEWLVQNNYLTPYQHDPYVPDDINALKIGGNGEFTEDSQSKVFDTENAHEFIMRHLRQYNYTKCMIFCSSIDAATHLSHTLTGSGFENSCQHSDYERLSKAEQSYSLSQFTTIGSGVDICISIASMNKGFDFPPVDLIMLNRATTSLPLYLQMCGRGSRLSPATGKSIWTVIDYGENGRRHGYWDATHDWENLWNRIPKKKEGVVPVKDCPVCKFMMRPFLMICPNCGHEFKSTDPVKINDIKLVPLEKKIPAALIGRHLSDLTPIELAQWAKTADKKKHATRVAKGMEAQQPGYLDLFGRAMGYKQGWASYHIPMEGERVDFYDSVVAGLTSG